MSDEHGTPSETHDAATPTPDALERLVRSRWYGPGGIAGLSKLAGVSRATLYAWFRGETVPDTKSLARLANILDMPLAELVGTVQADPSALRDPYAAAPLPAAARSPMLLEAQAQAPTGMPTIGEATRRQQALISEADDPIGPVARTLYERHFSQVPVRDGDRWIGLLTTEAIARWMAGRSRNELDVQDAAPVREVLAYADDAGDFRVVPEDMVLVRVIGLFDAAAAQGRPLKAVLVHSRQAESALTGIVTVYDLPHLRRIAAGSRER